MNTEEFKRKLTAILSADVEGYSRLMGDDEDATIRTLTSYRELMSTLIQKHRGRVVDSPGDNLLAEFSSVVDAVRCAVEIQEELRIRNAELPENRKMHFRIGINLGDVVEEGDRIYGDGINIAARVEGLAEGGGICISGTVYDSIKNKLSLSYESLGEHTVKNIKEPVRVYRMRIGPEAAAPVVKDKKARLKKWQWAAIAAVVILIIGTVVVWNSYFRPPPIEPASTENMAFPLPKKPSIAVLPFDNMSGDPEQEYIADGISENLITALSNIPQFFVIARNSTFSYKGKSVKIKQVSEDLGVRYVVEGSIQKEGDRVRIIAQLIDSLKGNHIWSEKYDRQMEGLFDLLDDIAKNIASALHVELVTGLPDTRCAESLEVWDYTMKALDLNRHLTKENLIKARELLDQALKLEPQNVCVLVVLSYNHLLDFRYGFSESPADSFKLGVETAKKALALFEEKSSVQLLMAYVYFLQKQIDKAIISAKKAISIEPNYADAYSAWGGYLLRSGYPEEGIGKIKKAMRLNPYYPPSYLLTLARLSLIAGRYDEAIDANKMLLERAKKGEFNLFFPHLLFAEIYAEVGQEDKAQSHAAEVLKINPKFSVSDWGKTQFYKDPADLERRLKALRKAGLPDEPPLPLPDKPSIAVLPFDNLSADPDQEYFADGMTEDLITDLSKIAGLFVIARHSTFQYKGKAVDIKLVSRELGVRYVLEGSVRKAYGKVRINAQLIDSKTGGHVWAERYDRDLKDIFALQDEVAQKIVTALAVKLTEDEQKRLVRKYTANVNAYDYAKRGWWYYHHFTREANDQARLMFERAIELEPQFAEAHAGLGFTYYEEWAQQWSQDPRSLERAFELASKAIAMNDSLSEAHTLLSHVYLWRKQYKQAITEQEHAIALNPNNAYYYRDLGEVLIFAGKPEEAIGLVKKAMRLDPHYPATFPFTLGFSYFLLQRYEEAIVAQKRALTRNPDFLGSHLSLAATYIMLERKEDAHNHVVEALRVNPQISLDALRERLPIKDESKLESLLEALRKAGLK